MRKDIIALVYLASLGIDGDLLFKTSIGVQIELMGLPKISGPSQPFFGCPFSVVKLPFQYRRNLFGGEKSHKEWTQEFLDSICQERFLEICRFTGAFQGSNKPLQRNQAQDALHIWTAEHCNSEYFLTLDYKLLKMLRKNHSEKIDTTPITPSELLLKLLKKRGLFFSLKFLVRKFQFVKLHVGFKNGIGWK
jgi:hypothetical protein